MTVNAINGKATTGLSAVDGRTLSSLNAINGQSLAPSAFNPTVVSDCTLWLSANNLALANNDPVATWPNLGSAGGDFTQTGASSTRPTYKTNQKNGFPALNFDGNNDRIIGALAVSSYITVSAYTFFAVVRPLAAGNSGGNVYDHPSIFTDSGGWVGLVVDGSNLSHYHDGPGAAAEVAFTNNNWYIMEARFDGSAVKLRLNGGTEASTAASNVSNVTGFGRMGVKYNDTLWFLNADVPEMVAYNRLLNSTELTTVRNGFNSMYAVF